MSYTDHEVFQGNCRFCFKLFQADSYEELLKKLESHEKGEDKDKCLKNKKQ